MTTTGVRPPLTARLRRSHWIALDVLAAVPAAVVLAASTYVVDHGTARSLPELALTVLLATLGAAPVALRRIRPLPAFCALLILSVLLGTMRSVEPVVLAFPTAYVLYMVAVTYRRRVSASALAAALTVTTVLTFADDTASNELIPLGLLLIMLWTFGSMAPQRPA